MEILLNTTICGLRMLRVYQGDFAKNVFFRLCHLSKAPRLLRYSRTSGLAYPGKREIELRTIAFPGFDIDDAPVFFRKFLA